jgi:hypothetical protein
MHREYTRFGAKGDDVEGKVAKSISCFEGGGGKRKRREKLARLLKVLLRKFLFRSLPLLRWGCIADWRLSLLGAYTRGRKEGKEEKERVPGNKKFYFLCYTREVKRD